MNAYTAQPFDREFRSTFHLADEPHHPEGASTMLGFWIYLMSDCLVFAALFAMYGVSGRAYAGGPSPRELFDLPLIALNTATLLFSSLTYGMAAIAMAEDRRRAVLGWLAVTGLLGLTFVGLELYEFAHLIAEGAGPQRSAFLSCFFALVGTHGLHVAIGLVWLATLMAQVARGGLTAANRRRVMCLSLFWHFLDVIWIGVFSLVYLMGVAA